MSKVTYKIVVCNGFNTQRMSMVFDGEERTPTVLALEAVRPLFLSWVHSVTKCEALDMVETKDLEAAAVSGRRWFTHGDWLIDIYVDFE